MTFIDTKNKKAIRKFDKEIIGHFAEKKGKKLSYFGLPGPEMLDILEWKDHLQTYVAVEIDENAYSDLILTALSNGLTSGFKAIHGDIDKIILDENDVRVCFPFDLINLDYSGGILYKDKYGESARVDAWDKLFQKQKKHKEDFLLLITLNARERAKGEMDIALDEMRDEIGKYIHMDISHAIEWYKKSEEYHKFKVYIPYLFRSKASYSKYIPKCYPPIFYRGSSDRPMTHFVFEFTYLHGRATHAPFQQSLLDILGSECMKCVDGNIKKYEIEGAKILKECLPKE